VIKHVINDDGGTAVAADFTITVTANNPNPASFPGVEAPGTLVSLDAGPYSVTEIGGPAGYSTIYSADCIGSVAPGETKTCTVTNDDIGPKLIVIKHVINDDGGTAVAADFTMTVTANEPSPASFPGVEAPGTTVSLKVGSYNVDESGPSGYSASFSADCGGSVTLAEIKTCTVTNDDVPRGTVIVEKQTIPGGAPGSFTFTGDLSGSISDNEQIILTGLQPGTYFSFEVNPPAGFSLTSIVCDDDNSEGDMAAGKATIRLDADEKVVKCVFTNTLESTPTPTPTPSPTPNPTPSPTPTFSAPPSPTPALTPTATPAVTPVALPATATPKPTPIALPATATPVQPTALPPTGRHSGSPPATWPWTLLALGATALMLLAAAGIATQSRSRDDS
jgi:hypothetical protein